MKVYTFPTKYIVIDIFKFQEGFTKAYTNRLDVDKQE